MINRSDIQLALSRSLTGGADFAEMFFEDKEEFTIQHSKGVVSNIGKTHLYGVGLYLLDGVHSVYVYTNRTDRASLLDLAEKGRDLLAAGKKQEEKAFSFREGPSLVEPNPIRLFPDTISHQKKIDLVETAYRATLSSSPYIRSILLNYFDTDQKVVIANSDGLWSEDRRITTRFRVTPTLSDGKESFGDFFDFTRPQGFEAYEHDALPIYIKDQVKKMETTLFAPEAPSGVYPVILEGGSCIGTFFHECCGHQFETRELAEGGMFWDKRGEQIASEKVTLIDDGTAPSSYGSSKYDDEGMPRQKNILIENGIMKGVLADRLGSRKLNVPQNGCGRRQNYTFAPCSRMSNTYLAAGSDDEDEMISSLAEGLFVTGIGGGYGGEEFSILASNAWWIKNGKLDHPVKNAILLGRGDETMKKIDRVGRHLIWENGGDFCGSESGLVPVTTSGPRTRVMGMVIGGKGDE